jgi:dTDP-D-glucose 4,6-dehydratase
MLNLDHLEKKRYCMTTSNIIKSLGWKEQITFDQGIDKTI